MFNSPFPGGAQDGDVFFHKDNACYYHAELNSWECRKVDITSTSYEGGATTEDITVVPIPLDPEIGEEAVVAEGYPELEQLLTQHDANWNFAYNIQNNANEIIDLRNQLTALQEQINGGS